MDLARLENQRRFTPTEGLLGSSGMEPNQEPNRSCWQLCGNETLYASASEAESLSSSGPVNTLNKGERTGAPSRIRTRSLLIRSPLRILGTQRQERTELQTFRIVRFCLGLLENSESCAFCRVERLLHRLGHRTQGPSMFLSAAATGCRRSRGEGRSSTFSRPSGRLPWFSQTAVLLDLAR